MFSKSTSSKLFCAARFTISRQEWCRCFSAGGFSPFPAGIFGCDGEQPHGHGAPTHAGPWLFPNEPGHRAAFKISTGRSAREGKDPHFIFAVLMGGQPCNDRYCVTAASPLHRARLLRITATLEHPAHPHQGTTVMWAPGKRLHLLWGFPQSVLGLLLRRHFMRSMQKVSMSQRLKKQQRHRDQDKAQSRASVQDARAV